LRARAQALALGPLRLAVIANVDAAQAAVAGDAADRWLAPLAAPRACRAGADGASPSAARPGHFDAKLPASALLAQGLVGAPVPPPGAPGRELAELTAAALDGDGLLAAALANADALASARIVGGARAPALVIDVRAPEPSLPAAVATVKALVVHLTTAVTDADLARARAALERRQREARADPRRRLTDLWSAPPAARGDGSVGEARGDLRGGHDPRMVMPTMPAWRAFLGATLPEAALVVVEGRPQ
jgi:hypothetical protein